MARYLPTYLGIDLYLPTLHTYLYLPISDLVASLHGLYRLLAPKSTTPFRKGKDR